MIAWYINPHIWCELFKVWHIDGPQKYYLSQRQEISPLCLPEIDYIVSLFVDTPR